MSTNNYTKITMAVMKAFALGYYYGRHIGVEENPYSKASQTEEYNAFADGYYEGSADWGADA